MGFDPKKHRKKSIYSDLFDGRTNKQHQKNISRTNEAVTKNLCETIKTGSADQIPIIASGFIHGLPVYPPHSSGNTYLHFALQHPQKNTLSIVQKLLELGADPTKRNAEGKLAEDLTDNEKIKAILKDAREKRWQRTAQAEITNSTQLDF